MNSKTDRLNSLFSEWKVKNEAYQKGFAEDGIINEQFWNDEKITKKKVLILLKDTNDYIGDLRKLIDDNPNIWSGIGYYNYAIQNTSISVVPSFSDARQNYKDYCRGTAIVNLKKITGGSINDKSETMRLAKEDKMYIDDEIRIIEPKVIICGGTFDICKELWNDLKEKSERVYEQGNIIFIDYVHPSVPKIRHDMLFYALACYYQRYLLCAEGQAI
jgi:hypothetical protein